MDSLYHLTDLQAMTDVPQWMDARTRPKRRASEVEWATDGAEHKLAQQLHPPWSSSKRVRVLEDRRAIEHDDWSEFLDFTVDDCDLVLDLRPTTLLTSLPPTSRRSSSSSSLSSGSSSSSSTGFSPLPEAFSGRSLLNSTATVSASSHSRTLSLYPDPARSSSPTPPVAFSAFQPPTTTGPSNDLFPDVSYDCGRSSYDGLNLLDDAFGGLQGWWETTADEAEVHAVSKSQGGLISDATATAAWTQRPPSVPSHVNSSNLQSACPTVAPVPTTTTTDRPKLRPRPTFIQLPSNSHGTRSSTTIITSEPERVPVPQDFATALEKIWDEKRQRFDLVLPAFVRNAQI